MFSKALGFAMTALPGVVGFLTYGMTQSRNMSPLASAAAAGAALAATDIAMTMLSGGLAGLTLEQVGSLTLNPQPMIRPALSSAHHRRTVDQSGRLGYLVPQQVGACYGVC